MMYGYEKSDLAIVAVKLTNNAERSAAELVEPRAGTKGNAGQQSTRRTQRRISVSQALDRIRLLPRVCDGTSGRIRSSAFDTRVWLRVQYVLCWTIFPLALALRSTDSATTALPVGFPRFVRRLHRYYDAVRLLVPVHHRLWLLAFPMRTVPLTRR